MEQKVCLDTSSVIDHLKGRDHSQLEQLLNKDSKQIFVSAVTAYELRLRQDNLEPVERFLQKVPIIAFDAETARIASRMSNDLKRKGTPVDPRDVFIAATAVQWNASILTQNRADFEKIHEVKIVH